ncbi:EamA family transporter [Nocardioides houyundeii]|uniref:EamA family transporter n=1 Tax=Nocardioides houyundeii TaxID=2045452 RepID=UPI000C78A6F2|nr:EamA family transporter [Nocardioides houyundeii]
MPLKDSLLATLVAVIWGVNFVVIDAGLDEDMPALLFVALRFTLVALAVVVVARPQVPFRQVALVGAFMSVGQFGLLYSALAMGMPPGLASLVLQAQVVLTVVFAAVRLSELPTAGQLAGVVLGAVGLGVVALGRSAATPLLALLVTVAAAASWACGNVVARRVGTASGLSLTVWSATVVPLPLLALSLVVDGPDAVGHALTSLSLAAVLSTVYTAVLASWVGYGIWNSLLARHRTSAVVPFTLLVPLVGMTAAWLVLGETPNVAEAVGGAVLLLGVATAALGLPGRRRKGDGSSYIETVEQPDETVRVPG